MTRETSEIEKMMNKAAQVEMAEENEKMAEKLRNAMNSAESWVAVSGFDIQGVLLEVNPDNTVTVENYDKIRTFEARKVEEISIN